MSLIQFLSIIRARLVLILLILFTTVATAALVSYLLPKQYTASADLVVDVKNADPVAGAMLPPQLMPSYLATQMDIIASKRVALQVITALNLESNATIKQDFEESAGGKGDIKDWLAVRLLKFLNVKPSRDSNIITINYTANDPQFAATLANLFAEYYIQTNIELTVGPAKQVAGWYTEQLRQLRDDLEKAQTKLSDYQRDKGIMATQDRFDVETARLAELSQKLIAAQTESSQQQSKFSGDKAISSPEDLPEVQNNPLVQRLKADEVQLEGQLLELSAKVGKKYPQYLRTAEQLQNLRDRLNKEIQSIVVGLRASSAVAGQQEASLRRAVQEQRDRIMKMSGQQDSAAVMMREVENAQKAYEFAMQRASQVTMQSQVSQANVTILNHAVAPTTPSLPKTRFNIAISVVLGGMLALAIVLLLEGRNRVIRSEDDLIETLKLPFFGIVHKTAKKKPRREIALLPRFKGALPKAAD